MNLIANTKKEFLSFVFPYNVRGLDTVRYVGVGDTTVCYSVDPGIGVRKRVRGSLSNSVIVWASSVDWLSCDAVNNTVYMIIDNVLLKLVDDAITAVHKLPEDYTRAFVRCYKGEVLVLCHIGSALRYRVLSDSLTQERYVQLDTDTHIDLIGTLEDGSFGVLTVVSDPERLESETKFRFVSVPIEQYVFEREVKDGT